jgi:hypothetical protein
MRVHKYRIYEPRAEIHDHYYNPEHRKYPSEPIYRVDIDCDMTLTELERFKELMSGYGANPTQSPARRQLIDPTPQIPEHVDDIEFEELPALPSATEEKS